MKSRIATIILCGALAILPITAMAQRITENFDRNWEFSLPDQNWRPVTVPHDWGVEGEYNKYNASDRGGGYLPTGIGYYKKSFTLPEEYRGKRLFLEFDGIMANSSVYVNGILLGKRPNGYVPLCYEITDNVKFGEKARNIVNVTADNIVQPASRWYTGNGIYRHVRLVVKDQVYMPVWATYIKTGTVTDKKASFDVQTEVANTTGAPAKVVVSYVLKDAAGKEVQKGASKAITVPAGQTQAVSVPMQYAKPHLWSVEDPYLYTVEVTVSANGKATDQESVRIGMRSIRYAAEGFFLNGKHMQMYGVCIHSDAGGIGSAVPAAIWRYRLGILKSLGVNAIRLAHNPVAPEFLDLCDEMGFLVMDESFDTWTAAKPHAEKGYNLFFKEWWERDTRDMVMHDRNHPSVVIYSVGNEIRDNLTTPEGFAKYTDQRDLIHKLDGTRPATMALFRPVSSGVYSNGFAEIMDVVGQNYRIDEFMGYHEAHPERCMMGTEDTHDIATWLVMRDNPWVCGQFLWTGIDYLGEADWPRVKHGAGLIDVTGKVKESGLQRKSWWTSEPMVALAIAEAPAQPAAQASPEAAPAVPVHYVMGQLVDEEGYRVQTGPRRPGRTFNATVYSNCDEVEMFVNGESLGRQAVPGNAEPVKYAFAGSPSAYVVAGYRDGEKVTEYQEKVAGAPHHIVLSLEGGSLGNSFDDAAVIRATVVDKDGNVCKTDDHTITFSVEGAELLAVDSGNLESHEKYRSNSRQAFEGSCVAYIRARSPRGGVTVTASAIGLEGTATLKPGQTGVPTEQFAAPAGGNVTAYMICHGSVAFEYNGYNIQIDPVAKNAGQTIDYSAFPKADIILITHEHGDHLDPATIRTLSKEGTKILCNASSVAKIPGAEVIGNGAEKKVAGIGIKAVPAYNISEGKTNFHPKGNGNGYVLSIGGLQIYVAGDTEDIPEMAQRKGVDVAFLPVNQPFSMTVEQCIRAAKIISPKVLVPYHLGNTQYQGIKDGLEGSGIDVKLFESLK